MDSGEEEKLVDVWRQDTTPVIFRQGKGFPLLVKLPATLNDDFWILYSKRSLPSRDVQYNCWKIPKSWFSNLVERLLKRCGQLYIIQPYNENEKCCYACQNAIHHICECSCMGANHGSLNIDNEWFSVSEAFVASRKERLLACRLMQNNLTQSLPKDST